MMAKSTLYLSAIIFLMLFSLSTSAQTNGKKDIVYLKNGSMIKGTIVEMIPDSTLKIETADGSLFIYKFNEIERTAKEEVKKPGTKQQSSLSETGRGTKDTFVSKGYFILARLGPSIHLFEGLDVSMGIINGYQINEFLSLGLGVEATRYSFGYNDYASIPVYPIFIDARFQIPKGRVNPMFSMQFGYSLVGEATSRNNYNYYNHSKSDGGLYMAIGAGVRIAINKRFAFLADGGFAFQTLQGYNAAYYDNYYSNNDVFSSSNNTTIASLRLNIGLAVSFGK